MINFEEYREKKKKAESEKREALLDEMAQINTDLIETPVPESDGKVNYGIVEKRREEEIEKLMDVSARMNNEARNIRERWKKEGFAMFDEGTY